MAIRSICVQYKRKEIGEEEASWSTEKHLEVRSRCHEREAMQLSELQSYSQEVQ